jgi:hypothetical protein
MNVGNYVYIDNQAQIWWQPFDLTAPPQLLADSDSLCGKILETGPEDPFRDACSDHDNFYTKRAFFEERGWNRLSLDNYFLKLMVEIAQGDLTLLLRANIYYQTVRLIGGFFYYRHPGYENSRTDQIETAILEAEKNTQA